MDAKVISAANKLKRIREAYIKQLPAQLDAIRKGYDDLVSPIAPDDALESLHRRVHTLRGSSASFGLTGLGGVMASAERLLKDVMLSAIPEETDWHIQWREYFARMQEELALSGTAPEVDTGAADLVAAGNLSEEKEQKTIYLCEDDSFQRLALATQIECFGFRVVSFGELEQLISAVKNATPDAMIMDMIFPESSTGGADTIDLIQRMNGKEVPTVFISSSDSFISRLSAMRAGSNAYFVKPVNVSELCATLNSLTSSELPEPYRILIVDDDPHLTELYALILQGAGMQTLTLNSPLKIMEPLSEFKPDLILTDMYMPGCTGIELASTVRQIDSAFSIPIVFLSSETDMGKQFKAMRMGGDEFLTKPVTPENLISAVSGRAKRMKILRESMVRDSMTGLYNQTALRERLEEALARAERQGGELCFAIIDLDRLKQINETYGQGLGDKVLVSLARLLGQRIRKTDIAGRYGGEEFAVILPDCDIPAATVALETLRESFAALRFPVGSDYISFSFSCGVAARTFSGHAGNICKDAEALLCLAKEKGRNCVVAATPPEPATDMNVTR